MSDDANSGIPKSTCSLCGYGLNLSRLKSGGFTMPSRPNHPEFPFSYAKVKKSAEDGCEDCHILQQAIDIATPQPEDLCYIRLNTLKQGRPALLLSGGQRVELFSSNGRLYHWSSENFLTCDQDHKSGMTLSMRLESERLSKTP